MQQLTDREFNYFVADGVALVEFHAPWCQPCKQLAALLDEIARELDGAAKIGGINVAEHQYRATDYNVAGVPTMLVFRGGRLYARLVGVHSKESIMGTLKGAILGPEHA